MFEDDECQAVLKVIKDLPDASKTEFDTKIRPQFLFALLYLLGLRINEVVTSYWPSFGQKDGRWWFFVKGKGDKLGHVSVNDELLDYVKTYRQHIGKGASLPNIYEQENLIVAKDTGSHISLGLCITWLNMWALLRRIVLRIKQAKKS